MTMPGLWSGAWESALFNHLWQSTAVAMVAWLLTLALHNNSARVRYAIWLIASVKFLVPFSLLMKVGAHWAKPELSVRRIAFYSLIEEFSSSAGQVATSSSSKIGEPGSAIHYAAIAWELAAVVWLVGCVVLLSRWIDGWRRASAMVRSADVADGGREWSALRRAERRAQIKQPIDLRLTQKEIEPGIFGVFRPVLLWPAELSNRLDDAQMDAVMAHEVEHVRRRDNLTSAIHAVVEAIFWFHPLVRWMTAMLNEERERACDERVMELNARPETYAESILKVCAFCVEPAVACVSGVSGADLKKRVLRIMTRRSGMALTPGRKLVLVTAALLMMMLPVGFGMVRGQSAQAANNAPTADAKADLPKYEVATIKPSTGVDNRFRLIMTPDGISLEGVPIQLLLQQAFGVENDRIMGAPGWVESKRYSIEAKVSPEDAPKLEKLKMEQRNAMILPLLEERFNLKYHHETRELPTYALVIAKGGPKLKESTVSVGPAPGPGPAVPDTKMLTGPPKDAIGNRGMIRMNPGGIEAQGGSTDFLAHALSRIVGRTVVNKTGLNGNYDFSLNWTPDEGMRRDPAGRLENGPPKSEAPPDAGGPSIFTALEEQLGLKLESQKGTVDVIVIDHIDQPSEN